MTPERKQALSSRRDILLRRQRQLHFELKDVAAEISDIDASLRAFGNTYDLVVSGEGDPYGSDNGPLVAHHTGEKSRLPGNPGSKR